MLSKRWGRVVRTFATEERDIAPFQPRDHGGIQTGNFLARIPRTHLRASRPAPDDTHEHRVAARHLDARLLLPALQVIET
jgi:hypothetical protein